MKQFPIGIVLESYNMPLKEALPLAASLGVTGVQVYVTHGGMSFEALSKEERRAFLNTVKDNGMIITALCGEVYYDIGNAKSDPEWVETSKRFLDLAKEFETNIVTTHVGSVPEDPKDPVYAIMQDTCGKLAEHADSMHAHFAIETGSERADVLKTFLDSLHSKGVAVNMDPANLVMLTGDDPVQAVHTLKDYIVHTHAKDGIMLHNQERRFEELPLGEGHVPFPAYLAALEDVGYDGYLTIEREEGNSRAADIEHAVKYLRRLMKA